MTMHTATALFATTLLAVPLCDMIQGKHRTEVPEGLQASGEIDPVLPELWTMAKRQQTEAEVLWIASYTSGWSMTRHELSGQVLSRSARIGYIMKMADDGSCTFSDFNAYQEHIDGGKFGPLRIPKSGRGAITADRSYSRGIDCDVAQKADYGYRGPK